MKSLVSLFIAFFLVALSFNMSAQSLDNISVNANSEDVMPKPSQGISWKPVVPIKNAIFVNYDEDAYHDDFAYLASVPASVFYSESNDQIYSKRYAMKNLSP